MENEKDILNREKELAERLKRLEEKEKEVKAREKAARQAEKAKKQVILRIAPSLWEAVARWAEEDSRSINGQIEYLLSEAVREKKKK